MTQKKSKKRQAVLIGLITLVAVAAMGFYIAHLKQKKADLDESARIVQEQIDGEIVSASFTSSEADGVLTVTLRAQCRENIAQLVDITQ